MTRGREIGFAWRAQPLDGASIEGEPGPQMTDIDLKFIVAGALLIALMLAKFLAGGGPRARPRQRIRRSRRGGADPSRAGGAAVPEDTALEAEGESEAERAFFGRGERSKDGTR